MKPIAIFTFCTALVGCSSPDETPAADLGSPPDVSTVADMRVTGDLGGADATVAAPDQGANGEPDMGQTAMDMSTLPTACTNDCLCESDCTHRCNIECQTECAAGASCSFSLNAGARITCRAGSTCDISCESGACEVTCEPGASCSLRCGPQTVACFFVECGGTEQECSNRQKTCDSAC